MKSTKLLHMVAFTLVIVGGVNWGLIGLMGPDYDLVYMLLGQWPWLYNAVLVLVGVSAVYLAATHMGDCKICSSKK